MNLKLSLCLATLLLAAGKIQANEQSGACAVYFSVLQNDEPSGQRSTSKMNQPQSSWYEKYGNRDKYAGICYVENGASVPAEVPLYAILWGEHSASEPYAYSYQATAPARGDASAIAGQKGSTSSVAHTTSDSSAETKHDVADGWLAAWTIQTGDGKGSFVPIGPLHSRRHSDASTALLEDAMEQIAKREKERLAARAKGWAVVTFKPIYNQQPPPSENPPTTSQSSADPVQLPTSSSTQTAASDPPPAKPSVAISAVSVSSSLPGAEIYVDDNFVGNAPSTINVTGGKHVITVKKSGYQDWVRTVNFSGGLITLDAELAGEPSEASAADPPASPDLSKGPRVDPASIRSTQKPVGWIGISTKNNREGVLVTEVSAEGPAALAGIHVGDVILAVDGRRLKSDELQTAVAAFKPGTRVPVRYTRRSLPHEVWITVASETQEH
jgi:hypothetical protein